jgi:hypothetical protein
MSGGYAIVKAWRKKNPDKVAAQGRRYRAKHPDKVVAIQKTYRDKNWEEVVAKDAERHARKRKADPEGARRRQVEWRARLEQRYTEAAGRPRPDCCDLWVMRQV